MIKGLFVICLHRNNTGSKLKFNYTVYHPHLLTESEVYQEIKDYIAKHYSGWTLVEYLGVA